MQNGQRGEVYEVNGDQVAVILDIVDRNFRDDGKNEKITKQDSIPSLYWIDGMILQHELMIKILNINDLNHICINLSTL